MHARDGYTTHAYGRDVDHNVHASDVHASNAHASNAMCALRGDVHARVMYYLNTPLSNHKISSS